MKKQLALLLVQSLETEGTHIKLNAHFEGSKPVNGHPPGFGLSEIQILPSIFGVEGDKAQLMEVIEAYCSEEQASEAHSYLTKMDGKGITVGDVVSKGGNLYNFYVLTDLD